MKYRVSSKGEFFVIISLSILYLFYWTFIPYRTKPWFKSNSVFSNINEFTGIKLTKETNSIIKYFEKELGSELKGEQLLISGRLPFLYFALNSHPSTCMSFFHSLPNDDFLKTFTNCLESKSPKYILSFIVFKKNNIYLEKNKQKNISFKGNLLQNFFYKTKKIKTSSQFIFRKYISRRPLYQSINEVDPELNKFIDNYLKVNNYKNCKINSLPSLVIKDLNLIYPNAIDIKYKLCQRS